MHTSCKKKCKWNIGGLNGHWFWNKNDGEIVFKLWGPFSIYQLIIKANPALFEWNWDGLVVLIHLPQDLKTILMALLFTNIFMSKPVTIDPPTFHALSFVWCVCRTVKYRFLAYSELEFAVLHGLAGVPPDLCLYQVFPLALSGQSRPQALDFRTNWSEFLETKKHGHNKFGTGELIWNHIS